MRLIMLFPFLSKIFLYPNTPFTRMWWPPITPVSVACLGSAFRLARRLGPSAASYPSFCGRTMAKHHPDLIMCRKQPGIAVGRLCEKCDGKCPICDSYVRPCTLVRICDECNYGSYEGRCVICGGPGISDAYYCKECTQQEKDRDGCPKIVNLGSSKTDLFYERKKYGFKKR